MQIVPLTTEIAVEKQEFSRNAFAFLLCKKDLIKVFGGAIAMVT